MLSGLRSDISTDLVFIVHSVALFPVDYSNGVSDYCRISHNAIGVDMVVVEGAVDGVEAVLYLLYTLGIRCCIIHSFHCCQKLLFSIFIFIHSFLSLSVSVHFWAWSVCSCSVTGRLYGLDTLGFVPAYPQFPEPSGPPLLPPPLPRLIDELYAQKLKYKAISEELDHALNDMTSM